jgi:pimeloyl-ACP methyl ester carboxylesterase
MVEEQVIAYAIPGHDDGGRLVCYGNKDAKRIVFFCGGWPDDCSVFSPLAQRLAASNSNLLCGVTCLPGYDYTTHSEYRRSAFSTSEVNSSLREACKVLRTTVSTNANAQLTGIFHDWGCVFGAMLVNRVHKDTPRYFSSLVYFDILPPLHNSLGVKRSVNIKQAVCVTFYTSLFAVCHGIQRYLSFYLAAPILAVGFGLLNVLGLFPTRRVDGLTFRSTQQPKLTPRRIMYMQYPYFNVYKALLMGERRTMAGFCLPVSLQETPVMYLYGLDKNLQFHNDNMLAWLIQEAAREGSSSKVISVPSAGHWLYLQQADVCYEAVQEFLSQS